MDVGLGKAVPAHADDVEADQVGERRACAMPHGMTSARAPLSPTIMAPSPMRTN